MSTSQFNKEVNNIKKAARLAALFNYFASLVFRISLP
jgi:hypothetical protein